MDSLDADPLHVLYVNPFPDLGGAEHSLLALLGSLPPTVRPSLVTSREGELAERARELGVPVHLQGFPGLTRRRASRAATTELAGLIGETGIGLVHGNSPRGAYYGGLASRWARVPSVWHLRVHLGGGWRPRILRWLNESWVAVSRSLLADAGVSVGEARGRVIPNGVAAAFLRQTPRPPRLAGAKPVIGMMGRLEPLKGQREFIEMAIQLRDAGVDARFVVAGGILGPAPGGPLRRANRYAEALERRIRSAGMADRVEFLGPVTDVAGFLDGLDLLVVPSHMEGFCRVVIEGMARALPVIASDVGGIPEIIRTGVDGWLVPRRDPLALFRAVSFLLRNPAAAEAMGTRAWRRVAQRYLATMTTRRIVELYEGMTRRELWIAEPAAEASPEAPVELPAEPPTEEEEGESCVSLST